MDVAFDDVQVGSTNSTNKHSDTYLSFSRSRERQVLQLERVLLGRRLLTEYHRAHSESLALGKTARSFA